MANLEGWRRAMRRSPMRRFDRFLFVAIQRVG